MSERFVVEAGRKVVGVAVRHSGGYKFYASEDGFFQLENRSFPSVADVTSAAGRLARSLAATPGSIGVTSTAAG